MGGGSDTLLPAKMTIKVRLTNLDTETSRGVRVFQRGQVIAELMPEQSADVYVWKGVGLDVQEFELPPATSKDPDWHSVSDQPVTA